MMRCFFPSATAFCTASTTSLAVAVPTPTRPFSSPITTTALRAHSCSTPIVYQVLING